MWKWSVDEQELRAAGGLVPGAVMMGPQVLTLSGAAALASQAQAPAQKAM